MNEVTGAPLADGVVRMWWRPGLGSAPGCVDIGWMDHGHVICKLVSLSQAATLVTVVGYLTGDPRPANELVQLLRIAQVAGPWREATDMAEAVEALAHETAPATASGVAPRRAPLPPLAEQVDRHVGVYKQLGVLG